MVFSPTLVSELSCFLLSVQDWQAHYNNTVSKVNISNEDQSHQVVMVVVVVDVMN